MKRPAYKVRPNAGGGKARNVGVGFAIAILLLVLGGMTGVTGQTEQTEQTEQTGDTNHHALLTALLGEHVHYGRVDYAALQGDARLDSYLAQLVATDPDTIANRDDRLALWLNAYNAYTLKVIVDNYPIESINDLHTGGLVVGHLLNKTVWDRKFVVVGGQTMSLNDVEHNIVRKQFDDARIHFALVCAARSCPQLRVEAYEGYQLDAQLADQGRIFFAEPLKNFFLPEKRTAYLSQILDWYGDDFGANDEEILLYVTRFLPDDLADAIHAAPAEWHVDHTKYHWELNGL